LVRWSISQNEPVISLTTVKFIVSSNCEEPANAFIYDRLEIRTRKHSTKCTTRKQYLATSKLFKLNYFMKAMIN